MKLQTPGKPKPWRAWCLGAEASGWETRDRRIERDLRELRGMPRLARLRFAIVPAASDLPSLPQGTRALLTLAPGGTLHACRSVHSTPLWAPL